MTPWLCTVPLGFCTRAWCILGMVVSRVPSGHGVSSRFFFPYSSGISSEPRLFLELCVFA